MISNSFTNTVMLGVKVSGCYGFEWFTIVISGIFIQRIAPLVVYMLICNVCYMEI